MLLRWSLGLGEVAEQIERAVADTIAAGIRTADIVNSGKRAVSTARFGDAVAELVAQR